MKNLIFVLILAIGCAEEKVAPINNSLEGEWRFTTKQASGNFEIVDYAGVLKVDNGMGKFNIGSQNFTIDTKAKIIITSKMEIFLVSGNSSINFYECDYNKTFTEITVTYWATVIDSKTTIINEPLIITR